MFGVRLLLSSSSAPFLPDRLSQWERLESRSSARAPPAPPPPPPSTGPSLARSAYILKEVQTRLLAGGGGPPVGAVARSLANALGSSPRRSYSPPLTETPPGGTSVPPQSLNPPPRPPPAAASVEDLVRSVGRDFLESARGQASGELGRLRQQADSLMRDQEAGMLLVHRSVRAGKGGGRGGGSRV